jgi:hypothetical protein
MKPRGLLSASQSVEKRWGSGGFDFFLSRDGDAMPAGCRKCRLPTGPANSQVAKATEASRGRESPLYNVFRCEIYLPSSNTIVVTMIQSDPKQPGDPVEKYTNVMPAAGRWIRYPPLLLLPQCSAVALGHLSAGLAPRKNGGVVYTKLQEPNKELMITTNLLLLMMLPCGVVR